MKNNTKLIVETWRRYLKEGDDNPRYHDPELKNIEEMGQATSDPDLDPDSEEVELPPEEKELHSADDQPKHNSEMTDEEIAELEAQKARDLERLHDDDPEEVDPLKYFGI